MANTNLETFGGLLRTVRLSKGLKQHEAAALAGCSPSAWGNAESGPHSVLGKKRVEAFVQKIEIDEPTRLRLLRLHAACPESDYQKSQRERWAKSREERAALASAVTANAELALLKHRVKLLEDCLACYVSIEESSCGCSSDVAERCLMCRSLEAFGLSGSWDPSRAGEVERFFNDDATQNPSVGNSVGSVDESGSEFG